jgi:hypothetical protein
MTVALVVAGGVVMAMYALAFWAGMLWQELRSWRGLGWADEPAVIWDADAFLDEINAWDLAHRDDGEAG